MRYHRHEMAPQLSQLLLSGQRPDQFDFGLLALRDVETCGNDVIPPAPATLSTPAPKQSQFPLATTLEEGQHVRDEARRHLRRIPRPARQGGKKWNERSKGPRQGQSSELPARNGRLGDAALPSLIEPRNQP
jgi:hypothetical protein